MKRTLIAAALAASATSAQADTWTLHDYRHWEVTYTDRNSGGHPMCAAAVHHNDGSFYIKIARGSLWFDLWHEDFHYRRHEGTVNLWVDNNRYHRVDAQADDDLIQMYPEGRSGRKLLRQIEAGYDLHADIDGDEYSDLTISLRGSRAAIVALSDCANKL